jgi:hypothetical protein
MSPLVSVFWQRTLLVFLSIFWICIMSPTLNMLSLLAFLDWGTQLFTLTYCMLGKMDWKLSTLHAMYLHLDGQTRTCVGHDNTIVTCVSELSVPISFRTECISCKASICSSYKLVSSLMLQKPSTTRTIWGSGYSLRSFDKFVRVLLQMNDLLSFVSFAIVRW